MGKPIRLLIADNDVNFSKKLKLFLEKDKTIKVINTVRDGHGLVNACRDMLPDIILADLHLPVVDSVRAIQLIIAQNEFAKILVVSADPNDRYAIEAVKAGACGYAVKRGAESYREINSAIHQIATGEVVLNPTLASQVLREFS